MRLSFSARGFGVGMLALLGAPVAAGDVGCGGATGTGFRGHVHNDGGIEASQPGAGGSASAGSGNAGTETAGTRTGGAPGAGGSVPSSCRDSRDCSGRPNGEVICDRALGQCVQCVATADCDPGTTCLGDACRPPCTSDKQCTPLGLLCDRTAGLCVDCLGDFDCSAAQCISGVCREAVGADSGGSPPNGGSGGIASGDGGSGGAPFGGGGGTSTGGLSGSGGGGVGGSGGISNGGATSGGQAGATGGQAGSGGTNGCSTGEKVCGGVCTRPSPSNGCDLTSCTACPGPAPANAVLTCNGTACDFVCLSGFTRVGNTCTPILASGGATGAGGAGGSGGNAGAGGGGACVPANCPKCCFGTLPGCCKADATCGCTALCLPSSACQ